MPRPELDFDSTTVIVALLIALAVLAAWLSYRRSPVPLRRSTRTTLIILRALSLSLIVFLLFAPVLTLVRSSSRLPVLAVLLDNSQSMLTPDRPTPRRAELYGLLRSQALDRAAGTASVRYYTFGDRLHVWEGAPRDSLTFSEPATDLSEALEALQQQSEREKISAALIISDGISTAGQNPLYPAERVAFPLMTVGVGDTTEQRDLVITRLSANDRVFSGAVTPVGVRVKSSGFSSGTVDVTLSSGAVTLDRQTITLGEGTREYDVRLSYRPEGEDMRRYTVHVSPLPGELTLANNTRSFFVRILRSKLRVVLLAGSPSPDVTALRLSLHEDADVDLRVLVEKSSSQFFEGSLTGSTLDSADCLLTVGFPTVSTSEATLRIFSEALARRRCPVLFIGGHTLDNSRLASYGTVLPFSAELPSRTEQLAYIQPVESTIERELLGLDTPSSLADWTRLPPIYRTLTVYHARPEARLLATTRASAQNPAEPLLLARDVDREKSLALLGYGVWRWRLMAQENGGSASVLQQFLSRAVRWLTASEERKSLEVTPVKDFFHGGEPVEFAGQLYDAMNRPVDGASVHVTVESTSGNRELDLRSTGSGRYEGELDGLQEGDYTYRASAESQGSQMGSARGRFAVGGFDLEFLETRTNVGLLRQLAQVSGGRYLTPATFDSLTEDLAALPGFRPAQVRHALSLELWNWTYTLLALIVLLGAEWYLRKRSGML